MKITKSSRKTKIENRRADQKHNLNKFMGWLMCEKDDKLVIPRMSFFLDNFGAHGRRTSTIFHKTVFDIIVKAKGKPHMKRTLGKIVRRRTYRQTL